MINASFGSRRFAPVSATLACVVAVAAPGAVAAGQVDPIVTVEEQAPDAAADKQRERRRRALIERAAQLCAALPNYRERRGARDPQVRQAVRLCDGSGRGQGSGTTRIRP